MANVSVKNVRWLEDGSATVFARITAYGGTGAATGVPGEGNWIKQADLTSITCSVFNVSPGYTTPDTAIVTPTVTIASAIQDTPVTSDANWTVDDTGWNFTHTLGPTAFPTGNSVYRAEYKFLSTASDVFWAVFEGNADAMRTS